MIEPVLPEHDYNWRVCQYNSEINEFFVTEDVEQLPSALEPYLANRDLAREVDGLKARVEKLEKKK